MYLFYWTWTGSNSQASQQEDSLTSVGWAFVEKCCRYLFISCFFRRWFPFVVGSNYSLGLKTKSYAQNINRRRKTKRNHEKGSKTKTTGNLKVINEGALIKLIRTNHSAFKISLLSIGSAAKPVLILCLWSSWYDLYTAPPSSMQIIFCLEQKFPR